MPTTTPFNNLITFSRGSNATVTGSNGLIQWAPNNLLLNSEQFDNANWLKLAAGTGSAPTVTANAGIAPDGTTTADRAQLNRGAGTTASDVSRLFQSVALLPTDVGTLSVWLRSFDGVSTYTVGLTNGSASSTVTVTGAWQRFSLASISSTANAQVRLQGDITQQTADLLLWGAQLELGSTATTYNPTTVKNLLGFSEAVDNAAWTKSGTSIVTGAQANPVNGLFNAQKLMENAASGEHRTFFTIITAPSTYTYSVYLKAAERTFASLIHLTVSPQPSIVVNLTTGAITSSTNVTASGAVNVGNGWWRVWMTYTTTTTTTSYPQVSIFSNASTGSYVGDGNSGVYIYGAQLSDSASLDPYVPTPGAAPSSTAFYGPRFDFDPVTLLPRGLLVEEQRTNLLLRSEEFGNVYWSPTGVTVTSNSIASPDGAITADTLVEDTSTGVHRVFATPSCSASTTYTFSAYVKAAGRTQVRLLETTLGGAFFDLSAVTVITTDPGVTASIANVGNGWFRCRVTSTTGGAQTLYVAQIQGSVVANNTYTGNGAAALYVWGAQLEAGAFATSYIPTVASTVTRSADVATITGQNFAQWYRQDEGAIAVDWDYIGAGSSANPSTRTTLNVSDGTANNRLQIYNISGNVGVFIATGGVTQAAIDLASTSPVDTVIKSALGYALNNVGFTRNGGSVSSDTSATIPTVNALYLGSEPTAQRLSGHIRNIRFIPARAADFQLQALST